MTRDLASVYPVTPAPWTALIIPVAVLLASAGAAAFTWRDPNVPGVARAVSAGSVVLVAAVLALAAHGTRRSRVVLAPDGLRLRGDLWGRRPVAADALRREAARVVDLRAERGLRPRVRTMGTALPGYAAGWFRLADGSRALLAVTDDRRVAYLPTTAGYALLVSARDADGLVAAVRAGAAGGVR